MLTKHVTQLEKLFLSLAVTAIFGLGMAGAAVAQNDAEPLATPAAAVKNDGNIEVTAKVLSVDPIKGDVSLRLEFSPSEGFVKEDGTLAKNIKLDINSSNGKQEILFEKGKRMTPTEAVLNMYEGPVTDYPFDKHESDLIFFFTVKPDKPAEKPKPVEGSETDQMAETANSKNEADDSEVEVPITLDFTPTFPGYEIESSKNKESDESYIYMSMKISRSPMVKFFSIFVMILMWAVSIAVLLLVLSIVFRGRKVEIAMFSFIATLLFAFVAVRNSQPAVPPIGTYTDYVSFFWAEVILAFSLLTILVTWLIRPAAK